MVTKEKVTLCELKRIVEAHMKQELDIMEMTFDLDKKDIEEFHQWYIHHPYSKGIRELQEIVRQRRQTDNGS